MRPARQVNILWARDGLLVITEFSPSLTTGCLTSLKVVVFSVRVCGRCVPRQGCASLAVACPETGVGGSHRYPGGRALRRPAENIRADPGTGTRYLMLLLIEGDNRWADHHSRPVIGLMNSTVAEGRVFVSCCSGEGRRERERKNLFLSII